jgi:CheY-like chemotaxis protein
MNPPPAILLVEDSDDDAFFMRRALQKSGVSHTLHLAADGRQAIDYLSGNGSYADRAAHPLPTWIFLDLKMPRVDGFEVLQWIRSHPVFHDATVFMLTSSPEERDKQRAEQLGVRHYLVKPPTPEVIRSICEVPAEPL